MWDRKDCVNVSHKRNTAASLDDHLYGVDGNSTACLSFTPQGYMLKKGHKRKNWTERWFMLKPNCISYYVGEDLAEKKGDIVLDGTCGVEARTSCFHRM